MFLKWKQLFKYEFRYKVTTFKGPVYRINLLMWQQTRLEQLIYKRTATGASAYSAAKQTHAVLMKKLVHYCPSSIMPRVTAI